MRPPPLSAGHGWCSTRSSVKPTLSPVAWR